MNPMRSLLAIVCIAGAYCGEAVAQSEVEGVYLSVLLASDFKHYGLSQTSSDPAIRFSVDYEHRSGLFAGGSIGNAEYYAEIGLASQRDSVANIYLGYFWRGNRWSGTLSAARYIYPDFASDFEYSQTAAGFSYRNRYFFSYTRSDDYLSLGQAADQLRVGVALPLVWGLQTSVNAGEFRSDEIYDISYSFWDVGASKVLGRFALDLRYHDDTYDRRSAIGETGDDRWVFSISYAISPRSEGQGSR